MVIERNSIQANWLYSYLICKRQAWLISRGIEGYQKNEYLDLGRLIHEKTYSRYKHEEILLPGIKIDVFYKDKKSIAIGEIAIISFVSPLVISTSTFSESLPFEYPAIAPAIYFFVSFNAS